MEELESEKERHDRIIKALNELGTLGFWDEMRASLDAETLNAMAGLYSGEQALTLTQQYNGARQLLDRIINRADS